MPIATAVALIALAALVGGVAGWLAAARGRRPLTSRIEALEADAQQTAESHQTALTEGRQALRDEVGRALRGPVSVLLASSEALAGGALEDPTVAAELADAIRRQSLRLKELGDDLAGG
ncbi:MAG: hypothetical protein GY913_04420 [Proteobacteria bacterium]|nr:hypothetical protein [Pseudomonadota bacterium]